MTAREWGTTGEQRLAPSDRLAAAHGRFEEEYTYALKSQTHLWIATLAHRASDLLLDSLDGTLDDDRSPTLDVDTIRVGPLVGCYVCEQSYERALRRRKCPGEPGGSS